MIMRLPLPVILCLCALLLLPACGEKRLRGAPLSSRVENLKQDRPQSVRRENAKWILENVHKLKADQKKILVPLLTELVIKDPDRLVRGYAAATLGQLRDPDGIPALLEASKAEKDKLVRCDVVKALAQYKDPALTKNLIAILQTDREPDVRQTAIAAVAEIGGKEVIPSLIDSLGDRNPNVVFTASKYLTELTGQTFGRDEAAWRDWWKENADKSLGPNGSRKKRK